MKRNVDKHTLIVSIITVGIALFTIWASTDNVWNSPNFDITVNNISKNIVGQKPVDEIVRVIYDDRGNQNLTAEWVRDRDIDSFRFQKDQFNSEDAWVLDRIYHNKDANGKSHKITLKNTGFSQAHDVIVQIIGDANFKIIDYTCPEIISDDQIKKDLGEKYLVSISRMSIDLPCEIIINTVESDGGLEKIIVTGDESSPRVWPDDVVNDQRRNLMIFFIVAYTVIGILTIILIYSVIQIYQKRIKNSKNQN